MPVTHGVTGSSPVHTATTIGTLTEWLGSGLQNRVQQFESAGYLSPIRGSLDKVCCHNGNTLFVYRQTAVSAEDGYFVGKLRISPQAR